MSRHDERRSGRRAACLIVFAVPALLAACSGGPPQPAVTTPSGTPAASATPAPKTPAPTASTLATATAVAPLTGLPGVAARPVIVVKIENSPQARPQSGLQAADIVIEELVEGGETRFAVFFQSTDPGQVGPVRSVRNVDAAIAGPTRGVLAFSGGAAPALAAVSRAGVRLVQEGDPSGAYQRLRTRVAPHNLYLRPAVLWRGAAPGVPPAYLPFAAGGPGTAPGAPASSVALAFSGAERPSWTFDRASGRWLRKETGGRVAVSADGSRLAADNVLILRVRVRDAGYRDPIGNPVPESVFTGTGQAVLLTDGRQSTGTWSKPGITDPVVLNGADGRPLRLRPGRTWIELVPLQGGSVQVR